MLRQWIKNNWTQFSQSAKSQQNAFIANAKDTPTIKLLIHNDADTKMKLLLTGLPIDATAEEVREGMEKLGTVSNVEIVSQNGPDHWAIIEMPLTDEEAFNITRRVTDLWHLGRFVNLRVLNH